MRYLLAGIIISALGSWCSYSADAIEFSDTKISQLLIGSWITPIDSSDYTPSLKFAVERFYADGRLEVIVFRDDTCLSITQHAQANWVVKAGVLLTYGGPVSLGDRIVSIAGVKMILKSLDGKLIYFRKRGTVCGLPMS